VSPLAGAGGVERDVSFEAFVVACSTRLLRYAYLLCGDRQIAEDLLQVTMLRTARRWPSARSAPEPYARAVLVNVARDRARQQRRRVGEVPIDGEGPATHERWRVSDHAELIGDRDAVLAALAELPQRQREVIVLRFYADLSVADTARSIGASEGTVMSYTSRGLSHLRQMLGDRGGHQHTHAQSEVPHDHR
jgi:RNA polymerase sigma-70 factor (sigma-E family)